MLYSGKKRYIFIVLMVITIISGGYIAGLYLGVKNYKENPKIYSEEPGYEAMQAENQNKKNLINKEESCKGSYTEVTTPETLLVFKKNYFDSSGKITEERKVNPWEVDLDEEDIKARFPEWGIQKFSLDEIVLTKDINDYSPDGFVFKVKDGKVVIFMPSEGEGGYRYMEETQIPIEILPKDVQGEIHRGLFMDSIEDVEHFIENFDS